MKTIDCCHKMMYERERRHEPNCNWAIISISYNVNYYYSVLSLSTQMSASGTSLPACVEWRTVKRERAAWWRWAVKPLQTGNPQNDLPGRRASWGSGKWYLHGGFTAGQSGSTLLWLPGVVFPGFAWCPELAFRLFLCTGATVNCSHWTQQGQKSSKILQ